MTEPISTSTAMVYTKAIILFCIPFVEPQIAGIIGSWAYISARHELKMPELSLRSKITVTLFGWMGAWATVNILANYPQLRHEHVQIISTVIGFFAYDIMLAAGRNSQSIIGFVAVLLKSVIQKVVNKWNS